MTNSSPMQSSPAPAASRKADPLVSVQAIRWAREQQTGGIAAKAALFVLADYANREGVCWPAVGSLAAGACTDERTMRRLLAKLEERGLVDVQKRIGRPSTYRLRMPSTPGSDPGVTPGSHPDPGSGSHPDRGHTPTPPQTPGSHPGEVGVRARGGRGDTPTNRKEPLENQQSTPARATPLPFPDGWTPHPGHARTAQNRSIDLDHEAAQFEAHARANDRRAVDWDAAFTGWLGNARRATGNGHGRGPATNGTDAAIAALMNVTTPAQQRAIGGSR